MRKVILLIGLLGLLWAAGPAFALSPPAVSGKARLAQLAQRALQRFSAQLATEGAPGPRKGPAAGRTSAFKVEGDPQSGLLRKLYGPLSAPSSQEPAVIARRFLQANRDLFLMKKDLPDLKLDSERESPGGYHVRFRQLYQGIPVYGAYVSVHMNRAGQVRSVSNGYRPSLRAKALPLAEGQGRGEAFPDRQFKAPEGASISQKASISIAWNHLKVRGELRGQSSALQVIYPTKGESLLAWQADLPARAPLGDWRVLVDAVTGEILEVRDLLKVVDGTGRVFDPNPVAVLGDEGSFLTDKDDNGDAVPEEAYNPVVLRQIDPSGILKGPYVDTDSTLDRVREPSLNFTYKRDRPGFEEAMVYYHLDSYQRYIQDTLGFSQANNRVQRVDARFPDLDNSFYSPQTKEIAFGLGGVDDAEDADVILHEYGHSIQDNQVPEFGQSPEAGAMGEGFSDYLAASFFASRSFDETCLAEWDVRGLLPLPPAIAPPGCLRRVDGLKRDGTPKHYPEDLVGEVHGDGEIWSGALWEIRTQLGQVAADRLILQSNFLLDPDDNFRAGALALLEADEMLNGGANGEFITHLFEELGILGPSVLSPDRFEENDSLSEPATDLPRAEEELTIDTPGDDDFYQLNLSQGDKVTIRLSFVHSRGDLDLSLFDPEGNIVGISDSSGNQEEIVADNLTPGIYVIRVAGYLGATNTYQMAATLEVAGLRGLRPDKFEENDSLITTPPPAISLPFRDTTLTIDTPGDDDYYRFILKEDKGIAISLSFTHAKGDLDLQLFSFDPKKFNPKKPLDATNTPWREKASSRSSSNVESIANLELAPGEYRVRVTGFQNSVNEYSLEITATPVVTGSAVIKAARKNGNGGAGEDKFTNNASVLMEVSTQNATQVRFTSVDPNDLSIPEKQRKWSRWGKVVRSKEDPSRWQPLRWNLLKGDGDKSVWVQFGNNKKPIQISAITRDTIILDTTPPIGSLLVSQDKEDGTVTLSLSAEDVASGVADMLIYNTPDKAKEAKWKPFKTFETWKLDPGDATGTVYVQYRDQAGNVSKPIKATLK